MRLSRFFLSHPKLGAFLIALGIVSIVANGGLVFALLTATAYNTTPRTVSSGTLRLTLANRGVGFGTNITNMAPTDTVNRYVRLTNNGNLAAVNQTLTVTATGTTLLTTNPTKGLQVSIAKCSVAWTNATGVCAGTTTILLPSTPLSSVIGVPQMLQLAVPAANVLNLRFSLSLPNQTETTTNNVLPVGTIQGLSTTVTWTFNETQRAGTTTNS
jgi:hypothetical protein